jgi:hypothetical protein
MNNRRFQKKRARALIFNVKDYDYTSDILYDLATKIYFSKEQMCMPRQCGKSLWNTSVIKTMLSIRRARE